MQLKQINKKVMLPLGDFIYLNIHELHIVLYTDVYIVKKYFILVPVFLYYIFTICTENTYIIKYYETIKIKHLSKHNR